MNLNYLQFVLMNIFDENKTYYFCYFSELIISENKHNRFIMTIKRKFQACPDFVL